MKNISYLKKVAANTATTAVLLGTSAYLSVANAADGGAAIAEVGAALIGLAGIAVVYKWVKGAIFG